MIYKFGRKTFVFCLPLLLWACGDYSKFLGGGYEFVRTNADNHVIVVRLSEYDNEIKVHSNVQSYVYDDLYILGVRVQSKDEEVQYEDALFQMTGYFVVNKKTGNVVTGLNRDEFDKFVNDYGLSKLAEDLFE